MKCKLFVDSISDYLDAALPGHIRLEFELHRDKCPACAEELERMERILVSLRSMGTQTSPVDCWSGVKVRLSQRAPLRRPWYGFAFRPAVLAPALALPLIAYLIFAGSDLIGGRTNIPRTAISVPEYSSYLTAHSHARYLEPLSDPEIALVQVELEKASLMPVAVKK